MWNREHKMVDFGRIYSYGSLVQAIKEATKSAVLSGA